MKMFLALTATLLSHTLLAAEKIEQIYCVSSSENQVRDTKAEEGVELDSSFSEPTVNKSSWTAVRRSKTVGEKTIVTTEGTSISQPPGEGDVMTFRYRTERETTMEKLTETTYIEKSKSTNTNLDLDEDVEYRVIRSYFERTYETLSDGSRKLIAEKINGVESIPGRNFEVTDANGVTYTSSSLDAPKFTRADSMEIRTLRKNSICTITPLN